MGLEEGGKMRILLGLLLLLLVIICGLGCMISRRNKIIACRQKSFAGAVEMILQWAERDELDPSKIKQIREEINKE